MPSNPPRFHAGQRARESDTGRVVTIVQPSFAVQRGAHVCIVRHDADDRSQTYFLVETFLEPAEASHAT